MSNKNSKNVILMVVATAIGAALYGVGGMIGIPIFANTTIKPAMAILALVSILYGPIAGMLVGFIGHWLTDMMMGWGVWITWVIGSAIVGLVLGLFPRLTKHRLSEGLFAAKDWIVLLVLSFVANFVGYGISGLLDFLLMGEPGNKVVAQAALAGVTNTIVIVIIAGIILQIIANRNKQKQNLTEE